MDRLDVIREASNSYERNSPLDEGIRWRRWPFWQVYPAATVRDPIFSYRVVSYDRSLLPNRFLAFMDEDVEGPNDWIPRTGRSLGHPGWGLVYHLILCVLDPEQRNLVVETGTNLGSTAIVMAQAIKDSGRRGLIRTVELDRPIRDEAVRRIELAGLTTYVESFSGDSLTMLPTMIEGDFSLRAAFLDGNHFHNHVVAEFEAIEPHLADDAVVLFDNTYQIADGDEDPRVHGALKTIVDRYGGHLVNLPFCSWYTPGIAIWQRTPFKDMEPPRPESYVPNKQG